ncbi:MAG TPA: 6-phosphogluconate dehydrogenase [Flavobacteriaceae bacterium]|jgi:hypothetical protein|nr:6-phosphogluconate dehydrogenase [Flavobacteriaceae bacterium]HBS11358.1 6-phosphogluconate dehydrogenase [Flavobacteriaceae bacterium]
MKKIIGIGSLGLILIITGYFLFVYYVPYSEGFRSGELIKISNKGVVFKTWEGEISQGVSESQRFFFSVEDDEEKVITLLKDLQGKNVKLTYIERFSTFPWLGDTKYFITQVEKTQ